MACVRRMLTEQDFEVYDDTTRLIFADWLEEQGEVARAELLRDQCRSPGEVHKGWFILIGVGQVFWAIWEIFKKST